MAYTTLAKVRLVNGDINIGRWADLDNTKNSVAIDERINWAITLSDAYLNGRLLHTRYNSHLPFATTPTLIEYLASLLVGIILYDGRLTTSNGAESRDEVGPKRKQFTRTLRQVLNGQLKLTDPLTGDYLDSGNYTVPVVLQTEEASCTGSLYCCCHTCVNRSIVLPDDY